MRDSLLLYVNGRRHEIRGERAFSTLARFLRENEGATGTKIVCEEGDCGACTVLVGRPRNGRLSYLPVNSCIQYLFQLDSTHVVTVEGLGRGSLTPVQEAMIECHGAQCGYCTPGFVVAMSSLVESNDRLTPESVREGLTGNLCRCTGYDPIIRAALSVDRGRMRAIDQIYPPEEILEALGGAAREPMQIEAGGRIAFRPTDLASAIRFRSDHPASAIVQGGTDIGVLSNKKGFAPTAFMTLDGIADLDDLRVDEGMLIVGGRVTISELKAFADSLVPELGQILEWFGAPQIRNAGTLAGNIANASPIADTTPFLMVSEARLELTGARGTRTVDITSFYKSYKVIDLEQDELITRIFIPLPAKDEILKLYRVSKRRNLDIASFTAGFLMKTKRGKIERIRIAYGGVAPVVLRLSRTEAFLTGKPFALESFEAAGEVARGEISPISDVRGTAAFRSRLAETILKKLYYEAAPEEVVAKAS